MRPQYSIIFFTTLAGMAQGLLCSVALLNLSTDRIPLSFIDTLVLPLAFGLLVAGLIASLFHLGHPERAWRSAMMWRTSWLSREVIALPLLMGVTVITYFFVHHQQASTALWILLIACCLILWLCTAKIYQCIRFIQEWSHPSTLFNFFLLGLTSGWILLGALVALFGEMTPPLDQLFFASIGLFLLFCSLNLKLWIWNRNRKLKPISNLASATGIRGKNIRQTSMGLMGGSFNTREFFHHQTDLMIKNIRKIILLLAYILPMTVMALVLIAHAPSWLLALAVLIQCVGLIAERWLFFAEANHPQNLYYQRVS